MRELMIHVERIVRPVRAGEALKLRMRRELLAHLQQAMEEERNRGGDEAAATEHAKRRLGSPADVTRQLQDSVPWLHRLLLRDFPRITALEKQEPLTSPRAGPTIQGAHALDFGPIVHGLALLGSACAGPIILSVWVFIQMISNVSLADALVATHFRLRVVLAYLAVGPLVYAYAEFTLAIAGLSRPPRRRGNRDAGDDHAADFTRGAWSPGAGWGPDRERYRRDRIAAIPRPDCTDRGEVAV
jgi:hypothetical protein